MLICHTQMLCYLLSPLLLKIRFRYLKNDERVGRLKVRTGVISVASMKLSRRVNQSVGRWGNQLGW